MISFKHMTAISVVCSMFLVGCSGGGGSSSSGGEVSGGDGSASLSGTLAQSSTSASNAPSRAAVSSSIDATVSTQLIVDVNKNGEFGDSKDVTYTTSVSTNGAFQFSNIALEEDGEVEAQLIVAKEGYAPVTKVITLKDGQNASVLAEAGKLPVQVEVFKVPEASSPAYKSSYLKIGMKSTTTGVQSYSKIMSLSQLKAEAADGSFGQDGVSDSVIPLSAFPAGESIRATMKDFDPTNPEDSAFFPGEYLGVGKTTGAQSTDEPRRLVSVSFDLLTFEDENGDKVELDSSVVKQSKLRPQYLDYDSCLRTSTRYLSDAQVTLIEELGDSNDNVADWQVPMWYYDYTTGMWQYLGEADYYSATNSDNTTGRAYAKMCVTEDWGEYLNLDYDFAVAQPKTVCVDAKDQDGNVLSNMNVYSKIDTSYDYKYLDSDGKATLALTAGDTLSDYEFYYSGALTNWNDIQVDNNDIVENTTDTNCDYDLSITVQNPYTTTLRVTAKEVDGSTGSRYVTVYNENYNNYFYQHASLNAEGIAEVKIKPNTPYVVQYAAKEVNVNANGAVVAPESADTTRAISVTVQDENQAPNVYVSVQRYSISENATSLNFSASANDANGDTVTFESLTLNGTTLVKGTHYTVTNEYAYGSYAAIYGSIDLTNATVMAIAPAGLDAGSYDLVATFKDSALSTTATASFEVTANRAPRVNGLYLTDANGYYVSQYGTIGVGTYALNSYAYDPDGDDLTVTYTVDGTAVIDPQNVALAQGDHTISVTAEDPSGLSDTESFTIFVGDRAPEISYAGTTKSLVDIGASETFKIVAYVSDVEDTDANLEVNATLGSSTVTLTSKGYGRFESGAIAPTTVGDVTYNVVVKDSAGNISESYAVNVTVIQNNQAPVFTTQLTSQQVNVGTSQTLTCEANDPEGTFITYAWSVNGVAQSVTGTELTQTFSTTGQVNVSCTATDDDGETSTSNAVITVIDPTQTGTLIVNTELPYLTVTLHDNATFTPIEEKSSGANGSASFNVVGDRASFSVTMSENTQISEDVVFKNIYSMLSNDLNDLCTYDDPSNAACQTYTPCDFGSEDAIPLSLIELFPPQDDQGNVIDITPYDVNNDGQASPSEVMAVVLFMADENSDGVLTYGEFQRNSNDYYYSNNIDFEMYWNMPVQTYNFGQYYDEYQDHCEASGDITITNLDSTQSYDFESEGSTWNYASAYNVSEVTNTYNMYQVGDDGKYSFVIYNRENSYFYPLNLTESELAAGVNISYNDFSAPTEVSITFGENYSVSIDQKYNGLWLKWNQVTTESPYNTLQVFDVSGSTYEIQAYKSAFDVTTGIATNYISAQVTSTLQSSYDTSSFEHLDVQPTFTENTIEIGGSDVADLSFFNFYYYEGRSNSETLESSYLYARIFTTQVPNVLTDIDMYTILPSSVGDIDGTLDYSDSNFDFGDAGNLSEQEIISIFNGDAEFTGDAWRSISFSMYDDNYAYTAPARLNTTEEPNKRVAPLTGQQKTKLDFDKIWR